MARRFNPYMLIPILLDVLVLSVAPRLFEAESFGRAFFIVVIALVWPWVLYFIIGRILQDIVKHVSKEQEENENHDFV